MNSCFSATPTRVGRFRQEVGALAIEVAPQEGGRIVEVSLEGENILAQKGDSPEYGSSFWPSPQRDWDWPPPPELASLPWQAAVADDRLVLSSAVNEALGLRAEQHITPTAVGLSVEYRFVNAGRAPRAVAPWENTRMRGGGLTFYASLEPTFPGSTLSITPDRGIAWLRHDPRTMTENAKSFAAGSEGWLAHLHADLLLLKSFPKIPRSRQAPTEAEIEIYVDKTGLFVEVEEQGAYETLEPGQASSWTVSWQLFRVPPDVPRAEGSAELVGWVRSRLPSARKDSLG